VAPLPSAKFCSPAPANAQAYTFIITNPFTVNGSGIINNSTHTQNFLVDSSLTFQSGTASGGTGAVKIAGQAGSSTTFNNSSSAGTAAITLVGSAALTFNDTSSAGGASISPAALGGAITFNNMSNAGSSTIQLAETTLTFNNASMAGSSTITMPDLQHPGSITFNNTSSAENATITNVSSAGLGTGVQFLGASTAGNATITNNPNAFSPGGGGTLLFGAVGGTDTSNAGTAHITNNSTASTSFLAGTSAMNATITNNNGGSTNFQDQSTAANATILNKNGGTTTFGVFLVGTDTATAGHANITNAAGGPTEFTAATMAGNATIINNAGGFLQFGDSGIGSSTATADNAVITNNGTTSFNALTNAGNSTFTTNNGGHVFFFDSSSGDNAQFITNAGGTFDMSTLTATGMTAGSIAGAGSYVLGGNNLSVGGNNLSTAVSGVISGAGGSLTKTGSGALTLSGINTYTGATTVNGGALIVDGSTISSSLTTVNAGATLGGSGTVGTTAITGGTLAPGSTGGNVFGPLTVQGNLSFTAASTYMIQVSPANAGLTKVTGVNGTATLGGATVNAVFLPGSYVTRQYTIVNASGGVSGRFNPAVTSNMASIQSTLNYDADDAFLNIKLVFTPPSGNLNINQQNVANALTNFFNATGSIPVAFAGLTPGGLTQASGELATGSQQTTFDAMNLFVGLLTDPFVAGRGGPAAPSGSATGYADEANAYTADGKPRSQRERDAYAAVYTKAPPADPFAQRWSVWTAGYGGSRNTDGNAALGSNSATASEYGTAVGADYRFSPFTLAGFAIAGGGTNFSVANSGFGRSDLFQAGAFVRHTAGPAYVSAALAYGWQDITTNRTVTIAGADMLHAEFNANAFSGRVEGGYRLVAPWMGGIGLTPYAAGQFTTFDLPAYAESVLSGASTFALSYAAKTVTDSRSELGLRTDKSYAVQDGILTLRSRFAWVHGFNPDRFIGATFQTLPGAGFVVNGAAQARDAALTTVSAEMKWLNGFSLAGTFEGEFSGVTSSYAGKGVVRYAW
jgi:autotransporter-associated beta strand protein